MHFSALNVEIFFLEIDYIFLYFLFSITVIRWSLLKYRSFQRKNKVMVSKSCAIYVYLHMVKVNLAFFHKYLFHKKKFAAPYLIINEGYYYSCNLPKEK